MRILQLVLHFLATRERQPALSVRTVHMNLPKGAPEAEYITRLNEREANLERCWAVHRRFWIYLIASATAVTAIGLLVLASRLDVAWIVPPLGAAAISFHALTRNAQLHARLSKIVAFYDSGIDRLRNQWQGRGVGGEEFRTGEHPYAADLDVFGDGSLFELLCTARTGVGRGTLATWLLNLASTDEILQRQEAVAELCDKVDLREEWASLGQADLGYVEAPQLIDWVSAPAAQSSPVLRLAAIVLPVALVVMSGLLGFGFVTSQCLLLVGSLIAMEAMVATRLWKVTRHVTEDFVLPCFELGKIAPLLSYLEKQQFHCPLLNSLQARLLDRQRSPSRQLTRLRLLAFLLDLRRSEYFAAALSLVLWGTNLALAVDRWREYNRGSLSEWLVALGEFEALLCLARNSYENPDHTFPILQPGTSPLFKGDSLRHPLLAQNSCVPCDVELDSQCRFLMVSGSNMSGKSTLLRSVGLNAVLAFGGGTVRADRLEISPLRIGCSIAVHDSQLEGQSRFQAELGRVKDILAMARKYHVLFLFDEMLGGTNSKDRFFGARAILAELVKCDAIGLVTTHDLSLTELVAEFLGTGRNVHFEEHYREGQMYFDYRMRSGILTHTNGINIINALGLLLR
jgi:hypothetical protein